LKGADRGYPGIKKDSRRQGKVGRGVISTRRKRECSRPRAIAVAGVNHQRGDVVFDLSSLDTNIEIKKKALRTKKSLLGGGSTPVNNWSPSGAEKHLCPASSCRN